MALLVTHLHAEHSTASEALLSSPGPLLPSRLPRCLWEPTTRPRECGMSEVSLFRQAPLAYEQGHPLLWVPCPLTSPAVSFPQGTAPLICQLFVYLPPSSWPGTQ